MILRIAMSSVLWLVLLASGCSPEAGGAPGVASSEASAARLLEPSEAAAGSSSGPAGGGQSLVDSEELIGLGELGLWPSLFQTFGTGIDCDFDDAFSTCQ